MKNGNEIRSRITCAAAISALVISLVDMGISHASAATTTPETDKAYGIINEDGSAKAGINSIADIRDGMTTTGADFVVDTDADGHPEIVLSPTELRNLLDVSYAADVRLETALSDLKTTTEATYAKKTEVPSTTNFLTKTDASNTYLSKTNASSTYATKSEIPSLSGYATQTWVNNTALSNYYTKAQVNSAISNAGSSSSGGTALKVTGMHGAGTYRTKCPYCTQVYQTNGSIPLASDQRVLVRYQGVKAIYGYLCYCYNCNHLFICEG